MAPMGAPSTRKSGPSTRKNVAVARREALRCPGLLAVQQAGAASSATQRALRRAASPHVVEGRNAQTSDASAPRECDLMISRNDVAV